LNEVLEQAEFDEFCETRCRKFYHEKLGRPSLAPGMYFRVMLIGFFERIESARGISWRVADSLCLRHFLTYGCRTVRRRRGFENRGRHRRASAIVLPLAGN